MSLPENQLESLNGVIFKPAAGFPDRLKIDREFIERVVREGEKWPECSGLYQNPDHNSLINQKRLSPTLYENLLSKDIQTPTFHDQLRVWVEDLRRIKPATEPVIVLDIGGGAGLTWSITAKYFEADIKLGRVAFVVSNLAWTPEQFHDSENPVPGAELVSFINSTFKKLPALSLDLPENQNLPLNGSVDLIHESQSLTRWSQIPEVDIPAVASLLSDYGSYFIAPRNHPCAYQVITETKLNQKHREMGVEIAHRIIQTNYGLQQISEAEEGIYRGAELLYKVFSKQRAPQLKI